MQKSPGGTKRPAAAKATETSRKRAPYTSRACGVCRRRKRRCSGDNPCTYCASRSLVCDDLSESTLVVSQAASPPPSLSSRDSQGSSVRTFPANKPLAQTVQIESPGYKSDLEGLGTLGQLVANFQDQIGTLTTRLDRMERNTPLFHVEEARLNPDHTTQSGCSPDFLAEECASPNTSKQPHQKMAPRKRFFGPTSPDYSWNMGQIRLQQGHRHGRPNLPNLNDSQSEDSGSTDGIDDADASSSGNMSSRVLERLTSFRRLLKKQESLRLIYEWESVFGDFHPIVDIGVIQRLIEDSYRLNRPTSHEDLLLITNLILAITLCAEPTSEIDICRAIYSYCREAIGNLIVSPTPKLKNVVILLLVGIYHFFRDNPSFSWRMVGMAGNMLLELGLHNREVPDHVLDSEKEREQAVAIICTTIVLDRQWSAAVGLPTHFQQSHFRHTLKSPVSDLLQDKAFSSLLTSHHIQIQSPYLKGMVSFMVVSDKFTSTLSHITNTDQPYDDDDDTFETLNFQIEQWRKNAVGSYNFTLHSTWRSIPISRIPSWAVMLNLRADAARSMLLRPFFFTNRLTLASRKNIEPAVHRISDTINILTSLDKSTDVYRKQQPYYSHLLVSTCSLMYLVVAYVAQHQIALADDLPVNFSETMEKSFKKAFDLAAAYNTTSRASRKLRKRLLLVRKPLVQLEILAPEPQSPANHHAERQSERTSRRLERGALFGPVELRPDVVSMNIQPVGLKEVDRNGYQPAISHYVRDGSIPYAPIDMALDVHAFDGASLMHNAMASGESSSLFCDWPLMDGQTFFSEGEILFEE